MLTDQVRDLKIEDMRLGMSVHYTTRITGEQVADFSRLCGDVSPLHVDEKFGRSSRFGNNLVHGMLVSSHFSTMAGVFLPGQNAVLGGLEVNFVRPVPVGSEVVISASVVSVFQEQKTVGLRLLAFVDGQVCVRGRARVQVVPSVVE